MIRIGDVIHVRLAQQPAQMYMGIVTSLWMSEDHLTADDDELSLPAHLWESEMVPELVVGCKLQFHADEERCIRLMHDQIERVLHIDEWSQLAEPREFVENMLRNCYRLVRRHYGQYPDWSSHQPVFGWEEPIEKPAETKIAENIFKF